MLLPIHRRKLAGVVEGFRWSLTGTVTRRAGAARVGHCRGERDVPSEDGNQDRGRGVTTTTRCFGQLHHPRIVLPHRFAETGRFANR